MPRCLRPRTTHIILILVLSGGLSAERVLSYETYPVSGQWVSLDSLVDIEVGSTTCPDGANSIRFAVENYTGQMKFAYVFEETTDLSNGEFLAFWIRFQNIAGEHFYFVFLDDDHGRRRAFWDLVNWFDLEPMRWARLVVDPSTFWWGDKDFDLARVTRARFVFSAGGSLLSEVVWLSDLVVFEADNPVNQENGQDGNTHLVCGILLCVLLFMIMGFVTLGFIGFPVRRNTNPAIMAPLCMIFGMSTLVLISMLFALFYFDLFAIIGFVVSFISVFLLLRKNRIEQSLRSWSFRSWKTGSFLLPMMLLGFSLIRFTSLASSLGWAPLFDPQTHGTYISLILYHRRIPPSTYPVGNLSLNPLEYPMGFHTLGALISAITSLYPGEAILAVSTTIVIFLPSLIFSAVYIGTGSLWTSFMAYLLTYYLPGGDQPPWRASHNLLLGNFIAGTHPNLLGNALFLALFPLTLGLQTMDGVKKFMAYATLILSLAVVYYPLLPYALLFCLLVILKERLTRSKTPLPRFLETVTGLVALGAAYVYINWRKVAIFEAIRLESSHNYGKYIAIYPLFAPTSPYLVYTAFIFSALPLSFYLFLDKKTTKTAMMYWGLFLPLMLSQNELIYTDFLWFTKPARALILLVVASYIVVLVGASKVLDGKIKNLLKLHEPESRFLSRTLRAQALIVIALLIAPSMIAHMSYAYPANLQDELPHGNDLAAMKWLCENAESSDLILNFPISTLWLPSLRALNVVNDREVLRHIYLFGSINGTWLANRTVDCNRIISRPWDYELAKDIMNRYNLRYVYIGEGNPQAAQYARGQRTTPSLSPRLLSKEQRLAMYLLSPDLEVVYRAGNAVVFRVRSK